MSASGKFSIRSGGSRICSGRILLQATLNTVCEIQLEAQVGTILAQVGSSFTPLSIIEFDDSKAKLQGLSETNATAQSVS